MTAFLVAALSIALPSILIAWLALRGQPRAILAFAVALILVGSGYLAATGAAQDIVRALFARGPAEVVPAQPQPSY